MKRFACGILNFIFALSLSQTLDAQTTSGVILGDVTDTSGARLPGVTIKVVNQQTGAGREAVTNELGSYRFNALPPALYTLTAELAGFQTIQRANINLPIATSVTIVFTMEVASVAETITVSEEASLVETTENSVKTLIDTKQIAELPLKSRNFMDLAMLAPGVVMDQAQAARGQVVPISFGGMSAQYKSIWLEGVDFNDEATSGGSALSDPTRISLAQEAIQAFQVMANSYSPEFGRSASGVINIVSKAGGSTYRGNVFYFGRSDKFSKPNYFATGVPPFKVQQFGGTLSGPIRQNRAFFFFSYERQDEDKPVTVSIPSQLASFVKSLGYDTRADVQVVTHVNNYFGKLTFNLNSKNTLNISYLYDSRLLGNQQTGASSAGDHGYNDNRLAYFLVTNLTTLIGQSTVNELRVSRSIQKLNRDMVGSSRPELVFPTVSFGQAGNVPQGRGQYNWVVVDSVSRHFTGFFGQHDLKFGGQANHAPSKSSINNAFNGQFTFLRDQPVDSLDPSTLPYLFRQNIDLRGCNSCTDRGLVEYYLFVNDTWRITSRLTFNVGIRYDRQRYTGDFNGKPYPSGVPEEQFWVRMITGDLIGQNFKVIPDQKKEISPRVGLAWDVVGKGKTVIRAGYGIYRDRLNTSELRPILEGYNGVVQTSTANDSRITRRPNDFFPNLPPPGVATAEGGSTFRIPNLAGRFPYTQQFTIGVAQQLADNWGFAVDYVHTYGLHFPRTRNVNAPLPGSGFPLISTGTRLLLSDSSNILKIDQLQARIQKRFSNKLTLMTGYTLGSARSYDTTPTNAYNLKTDWGPMPNDVRHRTVINGLYELPFGIQLGGILTFNTAPPYNVTTGRDDNRDLQNNDRPQAVPYNSARGDSFTTFDLRTGKKFKFGESRSLEILWEMFNVFNTANFVQYQGNMLSSTFGKPRQALSPFQAQIGAKFTF